MSDADTPRPSRPRRGASGRQPSRAPGQPGPGPIGPGPVRPPIPWTPFGRGDTAQPDVQQILQDAEAARQRLLKEQLRLTRMRYGPGPDGTPPEVMPVTRADGQWPFLLIRSTPGDTGERPLEPGTIAAIGFGEHDSPDILFTDAGPATEPKIVDRASWPPLAARALSNLWANTSYDVWVHVWNLGQTQATGVRVRAYQETPATYLGGTYVDLGDRRSELAHLVVKAATFTMGTTETFPMFYAIAECMTDPAIGDVTPGMDRHVGHRRVQVALG